jgi:hypothetical protein
MPLGKWDLDLLQKMKTRAFLEKVLYKSEKPDKIFSVDGTGRNTTGNPETKFVSYRWYYMSRRRMMPTRLSVIAQ